jgi:hypothetical protein
MRFAETGFVESRIERKSPFMRHLAKTISKVIGTVNPCLNTRDEFFIPSQQPHCNESSWLWSASTETARCLSKFYHYISDI